MYIFISLFSKWIHICFIRKKWSWINKYLLPFLPHTDKVLRWHLLKCTDPLICLAVCCDPKMTERKQMFGRRGEGRSEEGIWERSRMWNAAGLARVLITLQCPLIWLFEEIGGAWAPWGPDSKIGNGNLRETSTSDVAEWQVSPYLSLATFLSLSPSHYLSEARGSPEKILEQWWEWRNNGNINEPLGLAVHLFPHDYCPILPRMRLPRNMKPGSGQESLLGLPSLTPRSSSWLKVSLLQPLCTPLSLGWVGRQRPAPHLHSTA